MYHRTVVVLATLTALYAGPAYAGHHHHYGYGPSSSPTSSPTSSPSPARTHTPSPAPTPSPSKPPAIIVVPPSASLSPELPRTGDRTTAVILMGTGLVLAGCTILGLLAAFGIRRRPRQGQHRKLRPAPVVPIETGRKPRPRVRSEH